MTEFCDECGVSNDLHPRNYPDACAIAEAKARLIEAFGGFR